jgi:hypothetical protein
VSVRRLRFSIAGAVQLYLCCSLAAHGVERALPILPRHSVLGAAVSDSGAGLKVLNAAVGSPAEHAGLQVGDIVSEVGHEPVGSPLEFTLRVRRSPANTPISFQVLRAGRSLLLPIVLAVAPDESDPQALTEYRAVKVDDTLRRTLLTLPIDHSQRLPAVLIAGGIGCYSIDVATDRQDSYLRLAHDLSDHAAWATAKDRRVQTLISNRSSAGMPPR